MIELKAPATWSELSLDQFRKIVETLLLQLTREELLFVLMCELTGIRRYDATDKFVGPDGSDFRLQQHEIVDFCDRFAWIIDSEPDSLPNPTKVDGFLRDMSFGDWFETDTQFRIYDDDRDIAHFDIIMPKLGLQDEPRPVSQVMATMLKLWWQSVMVQIAPLYPNVFAKSDPKDGVSSIYNPFKQLQEFHLMLNDDRPQDNEKIDNARLHDVLSAMDCKIERQKREAAAVRKMNKH